MLREGAGVAAAGTGRARLSMEVAGVATADMVEARLSMIACSSKISYIPARASSTE